MKIYSNQIISVECNFFQAEVRENKRFSQIFLLILKHYIKKRSYIFIPHPFKNPQQPLTENIHRNIYDKALTQGFSHNSQYSEKWKKCVYWWLHDYLNG